MDKKRYEKAEIIIKKFAPDEVILASTSFVPDYSKEDDEMEIVPIL